LMNCLLRDV